MRTASVICSMSAEIAQSTGLKRRVASIRLHRTLATRTNIGCDVDY